MLLKTLENGKAIAVPIEGQSVKAIRVALGRRATRKGLSFRSVREGDMLKCWVEEMPEAYIERGMKEEP